VLRSEMNAQVQAVIQGLAPEHRMVVVLRYTQGLSYEEIAEILGCAPGTVASRLSRAHKILERRLSGLAAKRRANG
jgi:RNA polymerase sigma-70 factor, ECF subfamily